MKSIARLLFESRSLKTLPRSGYQFLGVGSESVAEHIYATTFIAFVLARLHPEVDALRLISMCLVHDLAEARTGDLNTVQKQYVTSNEGSALADTLDELPFAADIEDLVAEFEAAETEAARLARDADQLSFIVDLKALADLGYATPPKWLAAVRRRLLTDTARNLCRDILATDWDDWWLKNYIDKA